MKPYSVKIFRPDFTMVGSTNVNEVTYKEDYLASDENTITVLALPGIEKQDFIRISRGNEEYAGVVTEIGYGTDRSKRLQTISYKPLVELLNTSVLFDVDLQNTGTLEAFICDRIRETFIDNPDTLQNISGLSVAVTSGTPDRSLHITPAESGGHYNIVNFMDSVIVPAMQKYGILVKATLMHGRYNGGTLPEFRDINITLPSRVVLFTDSVCYVAEQSMWFIFVGAGLLFGFKLAAGGWGYIDTLGLLGLIAKNGCITYLPGENALHSAGCPQPSASVFAKNWNSASYTSGANFTCSDTATARAVAERTYQAAVGGGAAAPSSVSGTKIMGAAVATRSRWQLTLRPKIPMRPRAS